jgi:hypothetical protein
LRRVVAECLRGGIELGLLLVHPPQLPAPERGEQDDRGQRQRPAKQQAHAPSGRRGDAHAVRSGCDNAHAPSRSRGKEAVMNDSLKTLLIVGVLILILWNLGAGLYYMLVDKGQTKRTVNSLTRRIGLSVGLILFVVLAIYMGWIEPHGVGRNPN